MKLRQIYAAALVAALTAAVVTGCAKPPVAEMDSAREAVFAAENDADAAQYGTVSLERARTAIRNMEDAANSKRYDAAKTFAEEAISAAEKAKTDGKAAAARVREEAASNLSSLRSEIEETSVNVNAARYNQLALDYNDLDKGIKNAYVSYDQAESSMSAGMYKDALDKALSVRAELADINQKITNAVQRRK